MIFVINATIELARELLNNASRLCPIIEDLSYALAMHGFNVTQTGLLLINNSSYQVCHNGTLLLL